MQHILGKGWKSPVDAARAHFHAQQKLSISPDQVLKVPSAADDPAWGEVFTKLGRPEKPDQYELPEWKTDEGGTDIVPAYREVAHKVGLSQAQAKGLMEWWGQELAKAGEAATARKAQDFASFNQDRGSAIQQEFGAKYAEAQLSVDSACQRFGIEPDTLAGIIEGLSTLPRAEAIEHGKALFRALAKIGIQTGEHRTPAGSGPAGYEGTPAWAKAEIGKLEGDKTFMAAYNKGEDWAVKRRTDLFKLAYPA